MPKISNKKKTIKLCEDFAVNNLLMLEVFGENNEKQRNEAEVILEELALVVIVAESSRYCVPFVHNSVPKSQQFLTDVLPNLDEDRFKRIVRVNWENFKVIFDLIKNHKVFNSRRSCQQLPVETQLMIVLYRLGSSGEGATIGKIASLFGVGDGGTVQIITDRIFTAILTLKKQFINWPDASERKSIVADTFEELPHCIGYVDGSEIKLSETLIEDPEAYFSRKHIYSMKVQAVCDYKLQIRHMVLGYPGSVHDARIYNNCELTTKKQNFFNGAEWLAGDTAYKISTSVITPFRQNSTEGSLQQRKIFNKRFCGYRIRIEHCFGLLKERFNSLKELKLQIGGDKSIKQACRWILVCAILHNIIMSNTGTQDVLEMLKEITVDSDSEEEPETIDHDNGTEVEGKTKRRALLEILQELT